MPVTFSNPRLQATFNDWPSGSKRVQCVFNIENGGKKGFRCTRTTTGKPKLNTYGGKAAIVDGSDGRTYLIQNAGSFNFIKVSASDFMDAQEAMIGFKSAVFPGDAMYEPLKALIEQANS